MTPAKQAPQFTATVQTRELAERLKRAAVGEIVPYIDLSRICGFSVQTGKGRKRLDSARDIVRREAEIVFGVVQSQGLKRLDNAEIVNLGPASRKRIARAARRTVKKIVCVDYGALSSSDKIKHNGEMAVLAVIASSARDATVRKISPGVEAGVPPLAETIRLTLEAFKNSKETDE